MPDSDAAQIGVIERQKKVTALTAELEQAEAPWKPPPIIWTGYWNSQNGRKLPGTMPRAGWRMLIGNSPPCHPRSVV